MPVVMQVGFLIVILAGEAQVVVDKVDAHLRLAIAAVGRSPDLGAAGVDEALGGAQVVVQVIIGAGLGAMGDERQGFAVEVQIIPQGGAVGGAFAQQQPPRAIVVMGGDGARGLAYPAVVGIIAVAGQEGAVLFHPQQVVVVVVNERAAAIGADVAVVVVGVERRLVAAEAGQAVAVAHMGIGDGRQRIVGDVDAPDPGDPPQLVMAVAVVQVPGLEAEDIVALIEAAAVSHPGAKGRHRAEGGVGDVGGDRGAVGGDGADPPGAVSLQPDHQAGRVGDAAQLTRAGVVGILGQIAVATGDAGNRQQLAKAVVLVTVAAAGIADAAEAAIAVAPLIVAVADVLIRARVVDAGEAVEDIIGIAGADALGIGMADQVAGGIVGVGGGAGVRGGGADAVAQVVMGIVGHGGIGIGHRGRVVLNIVGGAVGGRWWCYQKRPTLSTVSMPGAGLL